MKPKHPTQHAFDKAASTYDEFAVAQQEIGRRLLERLEFIRVQPQSILDMGCGTGYLIPALRMMFPQAFITGVDVSNKSLAIAKSKHDDAYTEFVQADVNAMPFEENSFDLIISNLMLPWSMDIVETFQSSLNMLSKEGLFLFTTLGLDTLKELRQSFEQVDAHDHVNTFYDMHDVGDAMLHVGFHDPVVNMEYLHMTYRQLPTLFEDLKKTGSHLLPGTNQKGLYSPRKWKQMQDEYGALKNAEGLYPATIEIIFGMGYKPSKRIQRMDASGAIAIGIDEIERK